MKYNITSNSKLINTDSYDDLQEVICASDAVITDYSSIMWDVSFTDIPCFIYANDKLAAGFLGYDGHSVY